MTVITRHKIDNDNMSSKAQKRRVLTKFKQTYMD